MKKRILVTLLAMVMVFSMAFSMTGCGGSDAEATWADQYAVYLEDADGYENENYEALKAELDAIRVDIGATYVYVMTPANADGIPAVDGDYSADGAFLIGIDGSEDPDDYATDYGWEVQFTEAWEGTPAAARSAWNDSDTEQCWSAFAPIYDSEGTVVGLLGVDYPCTEVAQANPEWNRDAAEWNGIEDEINVEVPTAVANMRQLVTDYATKAAQQLSGQPTWADQYAAYLEAADGYDNENYEAMKAELDAIRIASGATYVYTMTPANADGIPAVDGDATSEGAFLIGIDGSEDPDDYATDYGWEVQFTEAWEGTPAAARSAWNDSDTEQCWSAFAPIYDSEGTVVALLGFDYPCSDVAQANPEWNRDAAEWNGIEDEITVEVPEDVAEVRAFVTDLAAKYAKAL